MKLRVVMVIVIVGLVVALLIPWFRGARERAYVSAMRDDLRNLGLAQASYFYDHRVYTADLDTLRSRGFETSDGVILRVNEATASGWAATAQHASTLIRCYVFTGAAAAVGAATEDRNLRCD